MGGEKTNKQKTHKHCSDGSCGTIVPGTNPHLSQGQTGQNGDFTVELNRKQPGLSQGRVPICPRERSHLSQGWFLFVPDTVPPKMFMFIGFFLPDSSEIESSWEFRPRKKIFSPPPPPPNSSQTPSRTLAPPPSPENPSPSPENFQ